MEKTRFKRINFIFNNTKYWRVNYNFASISKPKFMEQDMLKLDVKLNKFFI